MSTGILTKFTRKQDGVAMIEFAFLLPVLMLFTLGVIEFGMMFFKSSLNQRNMNTAATLVEADPTDRSALQILRSNNLLNNKANVSCAKAYPWLAQAKNALNADRAPCANGEWATANPHDPSSGREQYFIVLYSEVTLSSVTKLMDNFISNSVAEQIIKIGDDEQQSSDLTCNGEALDQRMCLVRKVYAESDWSVIFDHGGNTLENAELIGASETEMTLPACTTEGWDCAPVLRAKQASYNSRSRCTGTYNPGTYRMCIGYSMRRAVSADLYKAGDPMPDEYKECKVKYMPMMMRETLGTGRYTPATVGAEIEACTGLEVSLPPTRP